MRTQVEKMTLHLFGEKGEENEKKYISKCSTMYKKKNQNKFEENFPPFFTT